MGLNDGKTEAPTGKRREDARRKGQVAKSRDVIGVAVLLGGFCALRVSAPQFYEFMHRSMVYYLTDALRGDRTDAVNHAMLKLVSGTLMVLMPLLIAVVVASVVSNVMQTGPMLITEPLKVDFTKMNPLQGLQRMFSKNALAELAKSSAKIGIVGWVAYGWMLENYPRFLEMADMDLIAASQFAGAKVVELFWKLVLWLGIVAAVDYAWQKYQLERSLMMTRQEVRDEYKQSEGSPEIKGAIRRRMAEIQRGRMMADVPKADVVVTNPTHYAVALKYDPDKMDAPEVVAKGQRLVALRIRELATQHGVPIVENPPLARSLHAACRVGQGVPPELYAAVAEVLAYVYRLSGKALGGPGRA